MFHRQSGLHTANIGSSNLTHTAQVEGLEWNVRVSAAENPEVIERFEGSSPTPSARLLLAVTAKSSRPPLHSTLAVPRVRFLARLKVFCLIYGMSSGLLDHPPARLPTFSPNPSARKRRNLRGGPSPQISPEELKKAAPHDITFVRSKSYVM